MSKRQSAGRKHEAASAKTRAKTSVGAGFRSFVICLLLAGIIGAAVKLYFSRPRIEKFIRAQIEKQNLLYKIEFKSARLTLARGLMPTFAIDVSGVSVSHFAPCTTEPFIEVGVLMLPVDWFKLVVGKIQLGTVVAAGVIASVDRAKCETKLGAASTYPASREPQQAKPWFRAEDLERIKKIVAGFEIRNGTIYLDNSKKFVQISYFDLWHKGDELKLEGEVVLPAEITYGETFPPLQLKGNITPAIAKLDARSAFDEGELAASIELTPTDDPKSPQAKVLFQVGAMPLSIFSNFLRKLGVLSNAKLQPKFLWLNCDLSSEGPLARLLKHTPLKVENCMVEGDAGRIDVGPAVRSADGVWEPFKVEIKDFNIEDLLKTFGEKGPSGVLSSFGTIKGTLDYLGEDQLGFNGALEGLEVYFSNRNVRAYQKITSINVQSKLLNDVVSGTISEIILEPGKVAGDVTFNFDKRFKSGSMNFDTSELSLDPKIEKLMADGLFEALSLKGLLTIRDHKLALWTGQIQAVAYSGSQLKVARPVVDTKYASGRFEIEAQAISGELSPDSKWLGWIKRGAGDIEISSAQDGQWIPISSLKSSVSVEQGVIGWKNATFTANQSKVQITSTGEITDNKTVAGLLTTIEPGAMGKNQSANQNRRFVISGSAKSPTLTPRDQ